MNTREQLLEHLEKNVGVLRDPVVRTAFERIDRADFVPEKLIDEAYEDYPLPIGYDQTISQPTTVVFMLEKLALKPGLKVLDIGSGSGWTTALMADIVGPDGFVFATEIIPELVACGQHNVKKYTYPWVQIHLAQKHVLGLPEQQPFDRILVSAAAHEEIPPILLTQLREGGRMIVPVDQNLVEVHKDPKKKITYHTHPGFVFVPLAL